MKFLTPTHHPVFVHWDSTESTELVVNVVLVLFIIQPLSSVKEFVNLMKFSMERIVFVLIPSTELMGHVLNAH